MRREKLKRGWLCREEDKLAKCRGEERREKD